MPQIFLSFRHTIITYIPWYHKLHLSFVLQFLICNVLSKYLDILYMKIILIFWKCVIVIIILQKIYIEVVLKKEDQKQTRTYLHHFWSLWIKCVSETPMYTRCWFSYYSISVKHCCMRFNTKIRVKIYLTW